MKLIDQGPGHVLHEIVVRMPPGETDVKDQGQRARDDNLVLRKLGHRDVQGLAGVGLGGVERDALDSSLGSHSAENFL